MSKTAPVALALAALTPHSELFFDIRGGRIAAIPGGEIQICE